MLGAIAGDLIGSRFEHHPTKVVDFALFAPGSRVTDDSVLTCAVADAILHATASGERPDYRAAILAFARRWPHAGYGGNFRRWFRGDDPQPYGSFGNGSAMRASPIGWAWDRVDDVLREAERSAAVSHDHAEGIRGAQSVALGVLLARTGADNATIRSELSGRFGYDFARTVGDIRPGYRFDVTCQGSVPEAILCFLEAQDWEGAVRLAVSLGGDADTQACIAGALAEARWGVPDTIADEVFARVPHELGTVITAFRTRWTPTPRAGPKERRAAAP